MRGYRVCLVRLISFGLVLGLSACSTQLAYTPPVAQKPPLEIDVPQAFVTEGMLHVRTLVKPLVNLKANQVSVSVMGIREGQGELLQTKLLSELIADSVIRAGRTVVADFEMNAAQLKEYRVVARWGAGLVTTEEPLESPSTEILVPKFNTDSVSNSHFSGPSPRLELLDIVLKRIITTCAVPPCEELCAFEARLQNNTLSSFTKIELALGIKFVRLGMNYSPPSAFAQLAPDEQSVGLSGLVLKPGESKELEVSIDQPLMDLPDGTFVPYLRILSAE